MSTIFGQLLSPVENLDPFIITAANPRAPLDVDAEFICIFGADEAVDVFLNGSTRGFKMDAGDFYRMPMQSGEPTRFKKIEVRRRSDATVANNTVYIGVGSGEFRTSKVTLAAVVTFGPGATVKVNKPAQLVTPADIVLVAATNTLIFAANANATRRTVRNTHATASVRISTSAASLAAGAGKVVGPGEEWESEVNGALYARSTGTPTLILSEETF